MIRKRYLLVVGLVTIAASALLIVQANAAARRDVPATGDAAVQAQTQPAPVAWDAPFDPDMDRRMEQKMTLASRKNADVQAILKNAPRGPALPAPQGQVVHVRSTEELRKAIEAGPEGATILVADGVYHLDNVVLKTRNGITIRSASGNREKVVLDGEGLQKAGQRRVCISVHGCHDFTIADMTIQNYEYGLLLYGDGDIRRPLVHNMIFRNFWVRGLKGTHPQRIWDSWENLATVEQAEKTRPRNGRIEYCLFTNEKPKEDVKDGFNGDYVSGIDMMWLKNWTIADNVFVNVRGHNGGGRGAIFLWVNSEDVLVERNIIVNCDRGVCFGNPMAAENGMPHMTRGIARNNFITAGAGQAIEFQHTVSSMACDNTVYGQDLRYRRTIEIQNGDKDARFHGNLVQGSMYIEKGVDLERNIVGDLAGWFVNPAAGDLHLTDKGTSGQAKALPSGAAKECVYDVDLTLTNDFDKDFAQVPVFVQVFRLFGRGVDYSKFNPKGFHVYDQDGNEVPFALRPVPPDFSLANDEILLVLPTLSKGAKARFRVTNTAEDSARQAAFQIDPLLDNPNNLISNGGFEKGAEGWKDAKLVEDVVHSGKKALMLEVPGEGGKTAVQYDKPVSFTKGRNYYFGFWGKCQNVIRHTYRYSAYARRPISGRVSFTGDPLAMPEYDQDNHLVRLMDDRDWYCYEANALSTLCTPQPALNTVESTLKIELNQENMPYLDRKKPARVWIDDVLLFEQPRIEVSAERINEKLAPDGFFLYRRAATCLNHPECSFPTLDAPRAYERITKIRDAAALGERKMITLGIRTPKPIRGLCLAISDLKGPNGAVLGEADREVEFNYTPTVDLKVTATSLEGWVIDGNPPRDIDRPGYADYLLGYRIPAGAVAGTYRGTIAVKGNGKILSEVPVELEIADFPLKVITDRLAGLVYNNGCQPDAGAVLPERDAEFYRYYTRCNFNYMMMFSRFLPFKDETTSEVDIPRLLGQMKEMRDVAGCTAGVGLYWDCSLDKQGRKDGPDGGHGLWPRSGRDPNVYRARVKQMDQAVAKAGLPPLVYMIWDEPRFCDAEKFGILKGTGALTTSDITFQECCEALQKGLFTHASVDTPGSDYGPAFRKFAERCGQKLGFDSAVGPLFHRYQTSFMMSWGAATCSLWHVGMYMGYHPTHKAFVRTQAAVGLAEGMVDFRYFATLQDTIEKARKAGVATDEVKAAEKYVKDVMDFCTDDYHLMSDTESFTYNGGPERWGDDWFYDHWRAELRRHILAIQGRLR
jgi:hypothetical protein